jgi:hypothetical protein
MIATMLKDLRAGSRALQSIADETAEADLANVAAQVSACVNQVAGAAGAMGGEVTSAARTVAASVDQAAANVASAARAHEAAADAVRELVVVVALAIALVGVMWTAREVRKAFTSWE